jgi:plastocyanin
MSRAIRTVVAGCCVLALAWCYGCNSANDNGEQKPVFLSDEYAKQHVDTTKGPKKFVVTISDMKFQPDNVVIHKGDTILFDNNDMVVHDVTEIKNKAWTSGPMAAGASWTFVPTQSADYFCSIHVVMKGSFTVR